MNRNIKSQKEAFKILMNQGGWFGDKVKVKQQTYSNEETQKDESREEDDTTNNEPRHSQAMSMTTGVHLIDCQNNYAVLVDRTKGLRRFDFDSVFSDAVSQKEVYTSTTQPLIQDFLNGYNATCLVYGQTGSGKTFSMFGPNSHEAIFASEYNPEMLGQDLSVSSTQQQEQLHPDSWGIVPRSCTELFNALEYRRENLGIDLKAEVSVSYIEIYGNEVGDLLKKGHACGQSKVAAQRYVLDGSSEVAVTSLKDVMELLDRGEKQKRRAATAINERSSRAHTLFIVTLRQQCADSDVSLTSRLFLADLGGSEQIKKSQPSNNNDAKVAKQRVEEAVNINLGLLALKQCVEALRKHRHVPYADSKLTMMLSAGLGGDCKTSIIVCGSREATHAPETISAMKFGQTCRGVYNTVKTNATMLYSLLDQINKQIAECEQSIRDNERWEEVEVKHHDEETGEFIEIRKKTVVVGADEYRLQLANLLRQKAELTGEEIEDLYGATSSSVAGFGDFHKYTGIRSD